MTLSTWQQLNSAVISCRLCPRLVKYREKIAREKRRAYLDWDYWGRPVPGFGDVNARVLLVALAPGAHGSNRTGRMFTGDASGDFLYGALHRAGFSNKLIARHAYDGLELRDVFISAVARCAPPQNKPTPREIANCRPYLAREIELLKNLRVVVALGRIGFDGYLSLLKENGAPLPRLEFKHGAVYNLGVGLPALICAYHPSKQNTQTGRLTAEMMDEVFRKAKDILI
ncbi:MAG: uracil-DNA glycosylase [Chloroflexi bacterium]|nr:uracil-DNA glycosylase [Chloroflexota bacterium]